MVFLSLSLLSVVLQLTMGQTGTEGEGEVSRFGWGFRPWFSPRVRPGFGTGVGTGVGTGTGTGSSIGNQGDAFSEERLTCFFGSVAFGSAAVTLRRTTVGSGWGRTVVTADVDIGGSADVANVNLVFTDRGSTLRGDTTGCSSAGMGPIIGSSTHPGRWGQAPTVNTGIVTTFNIVTGQTNNIVLSNLPGSTLQSFAGRGLALVTGLTATADGRQVFTEPALGCCALGYNNVDVTL